MDELMSRIENLLTAYTEYAELLSEAENVRQRGMIGVILDKEKNCVIEEMYRVKQGSMLPCQ